ncbi:MAG: hypothetical protein ACJASX_000846 [Limisphaerales bacterium]|jgi:hypothetical protein
MIGLDHLPVRGAKDVMGAHHVLQTFVNLWHMTVHALAARTVSGVMGMGGERCRFGELRVATGAVLGVLGWLIQLSHLPDPYVMPNATSKRFGGQFVYLERPVTISEIG